jgi:septal ring factor EnvC (AmiA/AmiB activator)
MKNRLDNIVKILPEGISEQGVKDICAVINTLIEEGVQSEREKISKKVASFLKVNYASLVESAKEEAQKQLTTPSQALNEILKIVKPLVNSNVNESVNTEELNKLTEEVKTVNSQLNEALEVVEELSETIKSQENKIKTLSEQSNESTRYIRDVFTGKNVNGKAKIKALNLHESIEDVEGDEEGDPLPFGLSVEDFDR